VKDVADQIAASLESTSDKIAIDPDTNALTVRALPIEQERISRLLAKLDATPIAVEIKCLLTRIGPDGKRSVLSKPQVRTLDGIEAMISVGSTDGESYEVTLVPKVILPEQVMDGVRQASSDMPPGR
jgi:type II secretory pathway component GspD/PulD (secretin)